ncbi:acetylglutamate kinase [Methanospirillum sp. J.3.6.1-F.2.7.3]|jgi:acetylglutamate kinase|uniref:Acetylglutamate kinase n=2 Tax=Methanospirillum TaxID=2202 RepID=A0A8E7B0Z3_9EURY|nr:MULTISPECIES: acetylglutamate kinase [Methanospirillum]MDX8549688.1 acetylglutamate kinase [Methanospirillum hungatei]NLW76035.1 acetylglutamate kinase [Methanomicrobiales archaeon]QVV89066.1 acetylglutamate kinase [Methanospirillum sp. J.3.6.1-F.2.7.3]QXO93634.1 acetylglutamate kinase [Methanospirillum hungatei]
MKREDVLMEALPYIQKFHGRSMVIKLGGHAMVDTCIMDTVIRDVVLLQLVGIKCVIVHGGGPEITEKMKAMGKQPRFVSGLRITDDDTLEVAQMVLVGKINSKIVSLVSRAGGRAVGISGNDANLIIARKMDRQKVRVDNREEEVDLGHVGEIEEIRPALLHTLLDNQFIPVISPLAIDRSGNDLNINADTAAGELAIALGAHKLISMTDVDGIMNRERTEVYRRMTPQDAEDLIASGVVSEGMIPKVLAVLRALHGGVPYAHIINGNLAHNLIMELFTAEGVGTMITDRSDEV